MMIPGAIEMLPGSSAPRNTADPRAPGVWNVVHGGNEPGAALLEHPDIKGICFLTADQIAEKLGIEKTAMIRARAGISYTLTEAVSEGHCGLPEDDLMPMAEQLLEIPTDILRDALQQELRDETVVADTIAERRCIFLGDLVDRGPDSRQLIDLLMGLQQAAPGQAAHSTLVSSCSEILSPLN